ncbi:MAG: LysR family transcriptional regulator [Litoreibacter sp.]|nr:LysR family transcriptional regulator [Litoreibacter sp.]
MNLSALQTFLTILETGSLVRASERLNVTQSTVTARLKALEEELGQTLMNRQKSGVTLTASGQRLKRYAETMTELWQQARQETALPHSVSAVCNIGCHPDLWPGLGKELFDAIRESQPAVALSVWQGGQSDLGDWLNSGLTDISLTYWPTLQGNQTLHRLPVERLILVSTDPAAPVRFDPGYVFVEAGEAFGRAHAVAYSDADTAKLSFGSAVLGRDHILEHGGSAYLPERLSAPLIAEGRLHMVKGAPEFERPAHLVTNDAAARDWPWLDAVLHAITTVQ